MADPFFAEIRMYPFNFAPTGWAFCRGQLIPISQNTALFALLGTVYGGDGKTNFALPDLQGRAPMQPGQGQGLSLRDLGEAGGSEAVTLLASEIPAHTHPATMNTSGSDATTQTAAGNTFAKAKFEKAFTTATSPEVQMFVSASAAGDLPHNNMQPYLALNFCIALQGIFPQRP